MGFNKNVLSNAPREKSLFLECIKKGATERSPFWFMRQAGRYMPEYQKIRKHHSDFLSMCYTPQAAADVTMQPIIAFDTDAAILFSDILVVPDALGVEVKFVEKKGPTLSPLSSGDDLEKISVDNISGHLSPVYKAVSIVRSRLERDKSLIGFAGAPWTIACYMVEGEGSKAFPLTRAKAYKDASWFTQLISIITEATIQHLSLQIEAGVDVVQLFDSWSGVLPESEYEKWVIQPVVEIVRRLREKYPHVPIIAFPRGSGILYERYAKETGIDVLSLDETVPLEWVQKNIQPHVMVQGNLDPMILAGDKDRALMQAQKILSYFGKGNCIFNLGHGIIPSTPPENVLALSEMLRSM